jgi:hypothetical protein
MDRLKLISAQGVDQDAAEAARLCLEGTVKLVWCMVRYPPENVIVVRAAEAWHKSVQQVLLLRSSFMLSVFHHRVYFEDSPHEAGNPTVDHFARSTHAAAGPQGDLLAGRVHLGPGRVLGVDAHQARPTDGKRRRPLRAE